MGYDKHISLLDCTLRDGGHLVDGRFGKTVIKNIIEYLVEAKIDIIEVGFLWEKYLGEDYARFYTISDMKKILPEDMKNSKISLMADFIDLSHLEPYDGTVEYIRLSFKRWRLEWAIKTAKILKEKGYKIFINPVNNNVYSDKEYIELIEKINDIEPYGFSIVDTFGVMRIGELTHRYMLVEHNLKKNVVIGVHLHENMGLSFTLAQTMLSIARPERRIIIDGSLMGMGRKPGNLCIEQIVDYMNENYMCQYNLNALYDAIDDYIRTFKEEYSWGYDISYALSAKYYLHRTYAEHLLNKERLRTKDIRRILSKVDMSEAETFNESYIDDLYEKYMNDGYDDMTDIDELQRSLAGKEFVYIIAPGKSVSNIAKKINSEKNEKACIFSVNFNSVDVGIKPDYIFLTNIKRRNNVRNMSEDIGLIITSNLKRDVDDARYTVSYNELVFFEDLFCDNSVLMLLNLLERLGITNIKFAGFDGRRQGKFEFFDEAFDLKAKKISDSKEVIEILRSQFNKMHFEFLTESEYDFLKRG